MGSHLNYEELKELELSLGNSNFNYYKLFINITIVISLYSIYLYFN